MAASRPWTDLDQEARVARAFASDFAWSRSPAGSWVCETAAGNQYLVSETSCGCPDWEHRRSKVGARCKHQVALGHMLIAEGAALLTPALGPERDQYPCDGCGFHARIETLTKCPVSGNLFCRPCQERPAPEDDTPADPLAEMDAEERAAFDRIMGLD